MTSLYLREILHKCGLELPSSFPRDLISLVSLRLPLAFIRVPALSTTSLSDWLSRRQIVYAPTGLERRLHGALVAGSGRGIVFLDQFDDCMEQQFTAAHETAHFLNDHLMPRLQAIRMFGPSIVAVLDGERRPTLEESLSAVLSRVRLERHVHLMSRSSRGTVCSWDVEVREQQADRLALELMAPVQDALHVVKRAISDKTTMIDVQSVATQLSSFFGLPLGAATPYAEFLLRKLRSRPTLSQSILGALDDSQ